MLLWFVKVFINFKTSQIEMFTCPNKHRRPWTPQQDQALVCLKQQMNITKWPEVAKQMFSTFNFEGRTQKQCRDRYVNFLKNSNMTYTWRTEDCKKLTELYYELGNKWSEIATYFPNTNGIYIKNKFYSRLRKAIRHLNMIIQSHFSHEEGKFTFDIIFKLVNNASHKHQFNSSHEVRELIQTNPKFFEDIIVRLIKMTDDGTNDSLKKKKLNRLHLKDQIKWKKIIDILKFLEKQTDAVKMGDHFEKDFHLETDHHQGFRNIGLQYLLDFSNKFIHSQISSEEEHRKKLVQATYMQLQHENESIFKHRSQIIIISDQKRICDKNRKTINQPNIPLSKKEETLSKKETQSPFKRKDSSDDICLDDLNNDKVPNIIILKNPPRQN